METDVDHEGCTASRNLALASLLDHADDLTGHSIAMISYDSGCVAEFFTATPTPGYQTQLRTTTDIINERKPADYHHYRALHTNSEPNNASNLILPRETAGPYRLAAITNHTRIYEATGRTHNP
ncbi:hypothetical protein DFR76_12213 [Nocardia pseudobrasiliensis]|uniref:Uncharacterized protein n=2 Tax=Nocardia pseudobrasiliensis TaxID=45979 RepID=A0A370HKD1_9NOCA|nr:hypothetical protein DFR76_12213 [Nocardia pseudobrasiliensis]